MSSFEEGKYPNPLVYKEINLKIKIEDAETGYYSVSCPEWKYLMPTKQPEVIAEAIIKSIREHNEECVTRKPKLKEPTLEEASKEAAQALRIVLTHVDHDSSIKDETGKLGWAALSKLEEVIRKGTALP